MVVAGVMPLYDDEKESYWMLPAYMKMLEAQDVIPLMLPLTDRADELTYFLHNCDGFLLTGGHDVSPSLYRAETSNRCGAVCELRDRMESWLLRKAVETDLPVLGICRGIQLMNACFGGTLYQDLPTEHPGPIDHHMTPPYDRAVHQVTIHRDSPLFRLLGKSALGVNSYHHQAVRALSPAFREMARSEDGLTEAIWMPDRHFIAGVQWHPEFSYETDADSRRLIEAFADSMRGRFVL